MHPMKPSMKPPTHPMHPMRLMRTPLCFYLAFAISGCATTRPPSTESARRMETRTFDAGFFTTMRAITNVLQDEGYTIDAAEAETGIVSATKETTTEIAEISEEEKDDESADLPVWAQILIVATVIPIVIWLITQGDDDDEDESVASASFSATASETAYRYRLLFNIEPRGPGRTRVRLSAQGSESCDGAIVKAGPVHDEEFFARFLEDVQAAIPAIPPEDAREDHGPTDGTGPADETGPTENNGPIDDHP